MDIYNTNTLIDEQTGNLAFKLSTFEDSCQFCDTHRLNHYSLIWIKKGRGTAQVDFMEYTFTPNTLIAVTPYQPFTLTEEETGKRYTSSRIDFQSRVGVSNITVPPGTYKIVLPKYNNWSPGAVQIQASDPGRVTVNIRLRNGGQVRMTRS